jgi:hypothetical protein
MKLVAKKDFANVPVLGITIDPKTPGFVHSDHIHKGFRFSIGKSEDPKELSRPERTLIVSLVSSESVVVDKPGNEKLIAEIDASAKADAARRARLAKQIPTAAL